VLTLKDVEIKVEAGRKRRSPVSGERQKKLFAIHEKGEGGRRALLQVLKKKRGKKTDSCSEPRTRIWGAVVFEGTSG